MTPSSIVLAGFPGIGKSELVKITGLQTRLPIVRVNLQQFSSNEASAVEKFTMAQYEATSRLNGRKYILLVEELDKIFELDPKTGAIVNRPVMSLIKDLMNDGPIKSIDSRRSMTMVDVRGAFIVVTMNFAIDRFKFEADPRLTTLEDVMAAYKKLSTRLADLKELLGSMFLPETVNRLIAKVKIMKPLTKEDYQTLIAMEIEATVGSRLFKGGKNLGQIWIEISPQYKRYLYSETVIPSEGARNTVKAVRAIVSADLESALCSIPKSSPLAGQPITLSLDYMPGSQKSTGIHCFKK